LTDVAVVGRILREYHQRTIRPSDIRHVHGSVRGTRVTYRLMQPHGESVIVRALRADAPVGAQFSGCGAATMVDLVTSRAATLAWLAERGYPAPRVVPTRTGELVGLAGGWLTLATTFVAGTALRPDRGQLGMLGETLGWLHSLPAVAASAAASGAASGAVEEERDPGERAAKSAWHLEAAVPATLRRLDLVEALLPAEWRPLHGAFRQTVEAVRQHARDLPQAVVHGDARPGNAILTGAAGVAGAAAGAAGVAAEAGRALTAGAGPTAVGAGPVGVTLIDWETSGLGPPVLDLGHCLLECYLDQDLPPDRPPQGHIQPADERIAAVAEGYAARRVLGPAELDLLPAGIRFGTAFIGAIHFEEALVGGIRGASMDIRLERLRNRLAVSQAVAERASHHLAGAKKRYAEPGRPGAAGA
jgi:Ser/Thr protein kinase RdoA (MazF antagonist)